MSPLKLSRRQAMAVHQAYFKRDQWIACVHATAIALERRGLVDVRFTPQGWAEVRLTPAGRAHYEAL